MLQWVLLLLATARVVRVQEAFYNNYAYTKVMADCLGQEVYHQYLRKVATARRECHSFLAPDLYESASGTTFTPFIPSQQALPTQQFSGVFTRQPTVFPQQHGVFVQHPGVISQQPGVFSRHPGFFTHQARVFPQQPRIFSPQPGIFSPQPGIFIPQQQVAQGVVGLQPQVFPARGVAPQGQRLPLVPRFPNNSQRWAGVLGPGEILEAKNMAESLLGNLTCVLNKLGVVNNQLEINYDGVMTNVFNMPVDFPLKNDLISSIEHCRDLTCLPVEKQQRPEPHQLQRLMAFLKCEKEARLMACLKHDLRKSLVNLDLSGLQDDGGRSDPLEKLLSLLVSAKSANELQLLVELEAL
ncbi:uncharacterized protein [Panulirus ornatus]|uniref:uncharacterized protein isoform X3 n=1 Tax=Panulirus ornatus TaxID=150431 RepID=UPI003A8742BA